jgi:lysine-specific demethylase 8
VCDSVCVCVCVCRFGPGGTVSPLHNDPYHNLLCQVVGSKYLRLYGAAHTDRLYAREGPVCNNSYIDLDSVDGGRHPLFEGAPCSQCVLRAGEMLYIPRHHWHYVRSLEMSFSVSFW